MGPIPQLQFWVRDIQHLHPERMAYHQTSVSLHFLTFPQSTEIAFSREYMKTFDCLTSVLYRVYIDCGGLAYSSALVIDQRSYSTPGPVSITGMGDRSGVQLPVQETYLSI